MNRKLKITFVMPRTGEWAAGGFRTVYQFANHLSRRGHDLTVVHPGRLVINPTFLDHVKNIVRYAIKRVNGRYRPDEWIRIEPSVKLTCVPWISGSFVPDGDVVFATAWQTAEWVTKYSKAKGTGFYFVQHLETWNGPEDRVYATWKLPLQKVVVSKWLADIAHDLGESAIYIPNGLDVESFVRVTPSEERFPKQLLMLYHDAEWKGCDDGLEALHLVRAQDPGIRVSFFGVPKRPESLPEWIDYYQSPPPEQLRELYNQAAIFVAPSRTEGWGLTGCEALLCGSALVATDVDGHREFAFEGKTALTSPVRDPQALAANILRLLRDSELRIQLAKNGYEFVRQLTWDRATNSLESELYAHTQVLESVRTHG